MSSIWLFAGVMIGYPILRLPMFFLRGWSSPVAWEFMGSFVVGVFFMALTVPLSLLVVPYRNDRRRLRSALTAWTAAMLSLQFIALMAQNAAQKVIFRHAPPISLQTFWSFSLAFDVMTAIALLLAVLAIATQEDALRATLKARELSDLLHREEMESLMMQLHPHFLFNTLNAVIALIAVDRAAARRTLHRLRVLIEQHARTLEPMATVAEEMNVVDTYLDIECTRFGEKLSAHTEVSGDLAGVRMPRLLLQPLVENAVRHGVRGDGTVRVLIRRNEDMLEAEVVDSGSPVQPSAGIGIGLTNARRRLELLYGDRYLLDLRRTGGGTTVLLRVPAA